MESIKTNQSVGKTGLAPAQPSYDVSINRGEELLVQQQTGGPVVERTGQLVQLTARPSLRASLAEALAQMFAFEKGGGIKSVLAFAVSLLAFSWFADSLLPLLQEASQFLWGFVRGAAPAHHFSEWLEKLVLPGALFLLTVALLIFNTVRNARPRRYESVVPDAVREQRIIISPRTSRGMVELFAPK